MNIPLVKLQRLRRNAEIPRYHTEHASGLDLLAVIDQPIYLKPLERAAVPTGIAVEIPAGFEGQVRPRSGRALDEGLGLVNSPGTVDADYRGEVKVLLINLGETPLTVHPGERIAQLVIAPVARAHVVEVERLDDSGRGGGGFGHTGR